jgi:hypothetical protein
MHEMHYFFEEGLVILKIKKLCFVLLEVLVTKRIQIS